jgi:hypothetical protein
MQDPGRHELNSGWFGDVLAHDAPDRGACGSVCVDGCRELGRACELLSSESTHQLW